MNKEKYKQKLFEQEIKLSKATATPGPNGFIFVLDHLKDDFNIGKIFRSAEIFGVEEIYIVGTKFFDCIPAKGTVRKIPVKIFEDWNSCYQKIKELNYPCYALDFNTQSYFHEEKFEKKGIFIFGHEELGLSFSPSEFPEIKILKIKQFGKTQSLNVSVSASIVGFEFSKQYII